ncbi:hypothetical protein [Dongia deserti]|uniref:hypothetical protein n=1 Tax=Dongia deserti TaxID=2268030 RepID=UPI0013C486CA|nr:hypothetical protein [Dongia deserti]
MLQSFHGIAICEGPLRKENCDGSQPCAPEQVSPKYHCFRYIDWQLYNRALRSATNIMMTNASARVNFVVITIAA